MGTIFKLQGTGYQGHTSSLSLPSSVLADLKVGEFTMMKISRILTVLSAIIEKLYLSGTSVLGVLYQLLHQSRHSMMNDRTMQETKPMTYITLFSK